MNFRDLEIGQPSFNSTPGMSPFTSTSEIAALAMPFFPKTEKMPSLCGNVSDARFIQADNLQSKCRLKFVGGFFCTFALT
jgi:hypothetical protein